MSGYVGWRQASFIKFYYQTSYTPVSTLFCRRIKMKKHFETRLAAPTALDFIAMRETVGWGSLDIKLAENSLKNSIFHVTIYSQNTHTNQRKLVAMGRIIGDGCMYFYIQDVIVLPEYQGYGLGDKVMQAIEAFLAENTATGATIGLLAAKGKEGFYQRYGYQARDGDTLGLGMCRFVK